MLATTLQLAQRMLEIGESEEEVARGLLSFLSSRYPWETAEAVASIKPYRNVCRNTKVPDTDPIFELEGVHFSQE